MSLVLEIGAATDVGKVRKRNEDAHEVVRIPLGEQVDESEDEPTGPSRDLLIVCDGMGGRVGGDVASRIARDAVGAAVGTLGLDDPRDLIYRAIEAAHAHVGSTARALPDYKGMGTTCVVVLVEDGKAHFGNLGDSRAYLIRKGKVELISIDHTKVRKMVERGIITAAEAKAHPDAGVLSQCIGQTKEIQPYVLPEPRTLEADDWLVLCSDGAYDFLETDDELVKILGDRDAEAAARELVRCAVDRDGNDNATAIVARVVDPARPRAVTKPRKTEIDEGSKPDPALGTVAAIPATVQPIPVGQAEPPTKQNLPARLGPFTSIGIALCVGILGGVLGQNLVCGPSDSTRPDTSASCPECTTLQAPLGEVLPPGHATTTRSPDGGSALANGADASSGESADASAPDAAAPGGSSKASAGKQGNKSKSGPQNKPPDAATVATGLLKNATQVIAPQQPPPPPPGG
jgi:serine/threonine protein phosphatase PrpC